MSRNAFIFPRIHCYLLFGRPISRILYLFKGGDHLSWHLIAEMLTQPTREFSRDGLPPPLFGLAPGVVCTARFVAKTPVRSYRTISPLPYKRAVCFCCTFRRFAPPRRYLAPCPRGVRTFLLSRYCKLSGRPACRTC